MKQFWMIFVMCFAIKIPASVADNAVELNGRLIYSAQLRSMEPIWQTDGTTAGTGPIENMPDFRSLSYNTLEAAENRFFFVADTSFGTQTIFVSDGTGAGTRVVTDAPQSPTAGSSYIITNRMQVINDRLIYEASHSDDFNDRRASIWASDGTQAGTQQLIEYPIPRFNSAMSAMVTVNNHLYFNRDATLWQSDGTVAGTKAVSGDLELTFSPLGVLGQRIVFEANDDNVVAALWSFDMATGDITLLADPLPGGVSGISDMHTIGDALYVFGYVDNPALSTVVGRALIRTDGTPGGTSVVDAKLTEVGEGPAIAVGNQLYFIKNTSGPASSGAPYELWRTDGTTTGTQQVGNGDIPQGLGAVSDLIAVDNRLYIAGYEWLDFSNFELYRIDGPDGDIKQLSEFVLDFKVPKFLGTLNGAVLIQMENELWREDATGLTRIIPASSSENLKLSIETNPETISSAGETVTVLFRVSSPTAAGNTNVAIQTPMVQGNLCDVGELSGSVSTVCTRQYVVTAEDVAAGFVTFTGTATSNEFDGIADAALTITIGDDSPEPPVDGITLVTTPDRAASPNYGWVLFADGNKQWVSADCRTQLETSGLQLELRPWNAIAAVPDSATPLACDDIGDDVRPSAFVVTTPDRADDDDYGWFVFDTGEKQWIDATCRSQIEAAGFTLQVQPWSDIEQYPDSSSYRTCDSIVGGSGQLRVVTTADRQTSPDYGWVVFEDGSKQWIDATCRTDLESREATVEILEWDAIAAYPDRTIYIDCASLQP